MNKKDNNVEQVEQEKVAEQVEQKVNDQQNLTSGLSSDEINKLIDEKIGKFLDKLLVSLPKEKEKDIIDEKEEELKKWVI